MRRPDDAAYKEEAFRSFNWVTYFQGMPAKAHTPFGNQWWFTDEFADGPRRLMDAFWAVPEWAPADESHLLGSQFGGYKNCLWQGLGDVFHVRPVIDGRSAFELCAGFGLVRWSPPGAPRRSQAGRLHVR